MKYRCPANFLTIGFGHRIYGDESYPNGVNVAQALQLLLTDIQIKERRLAPFLRVELQQRQYDALVSLAFNIGVSSLMNSRLLKAVNLFLARMLHESPGSFGFLWFIFSGRQFSGFVWY